MIITSADSPTRLIMMKTELKSLVRREQFARDAILCTVDASKNVVRREDEPMLSGNSGGSSQAGSTWGTSAMKRGGAGLSGHGLTGSAKPSSGLVGDRGWAAVASGSGRNSPAPASAPVWGQPTMAAVQVNGARATTAPIAGIVPNPNAPRRAATNTMTTTTAAPMEPAASEGPVPEDWEDDN